MAAYRIRRHWLQQLCKSCRTWFTFYCVFYFTCERSLNCCIRCAAVRPLLLPPVLSQPAANERSRDHPSPHRVLTPDHGGQLQQNSFHGDAGNLVGRVSIISPETLITTVIKLAWSPARPHKHNIVCAILCRKLQLAANHSVPSNRRYQPLVDWTRPWLAGMERGAAHCISLQLVHFITVVTGSLATSCTFRDATCSL